MKLISTGSDRFLTSDAVADAVLEYAGVLARAGTADTVTIPFVDDAGAEVEARLLLGPASQISLMPGDATRSAAAPALRAEPSALAELHGRSEALEPAPRSEELVEGVDAFVDFDRPLA